MVEGLGDGLVHCKALVHWDFPMIGYSVLGSWRFDHLGITAAPILTEPRLKGARNNKIYRNTDSPLFHTEVCCHQTLRYHQHSTQLCTNTTRVELRPPNATPTQPAACILQLPKKKLHLPIGAPKEGLSTFSHRGSALVHSAYARQDSTAKKSGSPTTNSVRITQYQNQVQARTNTSFSRQRRNESGGHICPLQAASCKHTDRLLFNSPAVKTTLPKYMVTSRTDAQTNKKRGHESRYPTHTLPVRHVRRSFWGKTVTRAPGVDETGRAGRDGSLPIH